MKLSWVSGVVQTRVEEEKHYVIHVPQTDMVVMKGILVVVTVVVVDLVMVVVVDLVKGMTCGGCAGGDQVLLVVAEDGDDLVAGALNLIGGICILKLVITRKSLLVRVCERIENELARARGAIRKAALRRNYTSDKVEDFIPRGPVYRNPYALHQP